MTKTATATDVLHPSELPNYFGDYRRTEHARALVYKWAQVNRPDVIEVARKIALKKFPKRPARNGRQPSVIELPEELKALK